MSLIHRTSLLLLLWCYWIANCAVQSSNSSIPRNMISFHVTNASSSANGFYHWRHSKNQTKDPVITGYHFYKQCNGSFSLVIKELLIADEAKWQMMLFQHAGCWYSSNLSSTPFRVGHTYCGDSNGPMITVLGPSLLQTNHPTAQHVPVLRHRKDASSIKVLVLSMGAALLLLGIVIELVRRNTNLCARQILDSEKGLQQCVILHET
eukprot:97538_1